MSNINLLGRDLTVKRNKNIKNNKLLRDYSTTWNTKKIEYYKKCVEDGVKTDLPSPFYDGNINYRKSKINFLYTPEEIEEMKKCKLDVVYFAENHCCTMTPSGIKNVKLRKYQKRILRAFQENNKVVFIASRQSAKCGYGLTNLNIQNNKIKETHQLYKLYFNSLRNIRNLTLLEKIKEQLYNLLSYLNN